MPSHIARTSKMGIALCLFGLLGAPVAASAETIDLTTQEWKPYQTVANGEVQGIAVTAVKCVLDKMGDKATITVLPWVRAQKDVVDGKAAGYFAASRSPDRDADAQMGRPFIPQIWRWYMAADTSVDVTNKKIRAGVLNGSTMQKWLSDNGYNRTQKVRKPEFLVKMLQAGRIDTILSNEIVFDEAQKNTGIPAATFKSSLHSNRPLGVYFGKKFLASHPGFLDEFNAKTAQCE